MVSNAPPAYAKKFMVLADGENLVCRFQELAATRNPLQDVIHIPGVFVWRPSLAITIAWSPVRVNYYTSMVASDEKIAEIEGRISTTSVARYREASIQICPRIFKKESRSRKTKLVDMSICIDALRHSYHGHVEAILLLSGDGDYLPLIREVMRNGTEMWLGAFSSGLDPKLSTAVDRFIDLDQQFFSSK